MATSNKLEKSLARAEQARTGDLYTVALARVRQQRKGADVTTKPKTAFEMAADEALAKHAEQWTSPERDRILAQIRDIVDLRILPVITALPVDPASGHHTAGDVSLMGEAARAAREKEEPGYLEKWGYYFSWSGGSLPVTWSSPIEHTKLDTYSLTRWSLADLKNTLELLQAFIEAPALDKNATSDVPAVFPPPRTRAEIALAATRERHRAQWDDERRLEQISYILKRSAEEVLPLLLSCPVVKNRNPDDRELADEKGKTVAAIWFGAGDRQLTIYPEWPAANRPACLPLVHPPSSVSIVGRDGAVVIQSNDYERDDTGNLKWSLSPHLFETFSLDDLWHLHHAIDWLLGPAT